MPMIDYSTLEVMALARLAAESYEADHEEALATAAAMKRLSFLSHHHTYLDTESDESDVAVTLYIWQQRQTRQKELSNRLKGYKAFRELAECVAPDGGPLARLAEMLLERFK